MTFTNIPYITIAKENEHNLFKGAIAENYLYMRYFVWGNDIFLINYLKEHKKWFQA
jgi:hypothetical protein